MVIPTKEELMQKTSESSADLWVKFRGFFAELKEK
jgi:hypothetical protein